MTTASPADQLRLLDLQHLDTSLAQLNHRVASLPERAEIASANSRLAVLRDRIVAAETEVGDLELSVRKAEADVDIIRTRTAKDEELLVSGSITSPKQLEELQKEVASLARRRSDLEDAELEVMELLESAQTNLATLTAEREAIETTRAAAQAVVDETEASAAVDRTQLDTDRASVAASLPGDLVALYEKIRADHSGLGAAPIQRGSCQGCRIQLPPSDLARFRDAAADEVLRCEECRRILVRTDESGL
jgi:predicted  nucleic acid-binding Zn-ribbon protein